MVSGGPARRGRAGPLLALLLPGCMTLLDVTSPYPERCSPYGGVRTYLLQDTAAGHSWVALPALLFFWLDAPLCLVADTLLLPLTIPYTALRESTPDELSAAAAERRDAENERAREARAREQEQVQRLPPTERWLAWAQDPRRPTSERVRAVERAVECGAGDPALRAALERLAAHDPLGRLRLAALRGLEALGASEVVDAAVPGLLADELALDEVGEPEHLARARRAALDAELYALAGRYPARCLEVARPARPGPPPGPSLAARGRATRALGHAPAPLDPAALDALLGLLDERGRAQDGGAAVLRAPALAALVRRPEPAARAAVLRAAGPDGPPEVRLEAARALAEVEGPEPAFQEALVAAFLEVQADPSLLAHVEPTRAALALAALLPSRPDVALRELARRGPSAAAAAPALGDFLAAGAGPRTREACAALAAMGPAAAAAIPGLLRAHDAGQPSGDGELLVPTLLALGAAGRAALLERLPAPEDEQGWRRLREGLAAAPPFDEAHEGRLRGLLGAEHPLPARALAVELLVAGRLCAPETLEALRRLAEERFAPRARDLGWAAFNALGLLERSRRDRDLRR